MWNELNKIKTNDRGIYMLGNNSNKMMGYIQEIPTQQKLINREEQDKIEHLKAQKGVKIAFESDRFIIYTYKVQNVEISVNFNTKPLVEWNKEQLKGVLENDK